MPENDVDHLDRQPNCSGPVKGNASKNAPRGVDVLRAIRRRLNGPDRWTTGAMARGRTGKPVEPREAAATAWSLDGALEAVDAPLPAKSEAEEALRAEAGQALPTFNDRCGSFRAVREFIAAAEERLERRARARGAAWEPACRA